MPEFDILSLVSFLLDAVSVSRASVVTKLSIFSVRSVFSVVKKILRIADFAQDCRPLGAGRGRNIRRQPSPRLVGEQRECHGFFRLGGQCRSRRWYGRESSEAQALRESFASASHSLFLRRTQRTRESAPASHLHFPAAVTRTCEPRCRSIAP